MNQNDNIVCNRDCSTIIYTMFPEDNKAKFFNILAMIIAIIACWLRNEKESLGVKLVYCLFAGCLGWCYLIYYVITIPKYNK